MVEKHAGWEERAHTFDEAWERLNASGAQQLATRAGTTFVASAAITTRGKRRGERVITYFQHGQEYGGCYNCCWEHYYNCNRTRIGMYSTAVDERMSALGNASKLTRGELLALIQDNGGPEGLDLARKDLSGMDLSGAAILQELEEEGLSEGDTFPPWAYVAGGRPVGIDLPEADLLGANLKGANLLGASLHGAYLYRVNLQGAILEGANLHDAVLDEADLRGAALGGADMRGITLMDARLHGANLTSANLQTAILEGANLQGAILNDADLHGADLSMAELEWATLDRANLQGAELWVAFLERASLRRANLEGATLEGADLERAHLGLANLQRGNLRGTNVQGAELGGADMRGADLRFADLRDVDLLDVAEGGLRCVRFYRARLQRTALRREQLGSAIGDEQAQEYGEAREAYLSLKRNFEDWGDYEAANWSYVKERQMEKMMNHPRCARGYYGTIEDLPGDANRQSKRWWWFYFTHTLKWLGDWLAELVCGYGESFPRVLATLASVYLLFTLGYGITWSVMRVTVTPAGIVKTYTGNPVDWAIFSLGALTTMDPAGLEPRNNLVQLAAGLEALLGIFLTGLLGFVVANRIRRS